LILEWSKNIFCDLSSNINEIIIELLLCCKYGRKLTNIDVSLKQIKLSHLDKEYRYYKEKIRKENFIDLHDACKNGCEITVKYLGEHGADVQGNKEALTIASKIGNETIVKYLVKHGADNSKRWKIV